MKKTKPGPVCRQAGFTLLEVMLAVAIIGVMTRFVAVSVAQVSEIFKVRAAGDEIRSLIVRGREMSALGVDGGGYRIEADQLTVRLVKIGGAEIGRYQLQTGVILTPVEISWEFAPITGQASCGGACELLITSGSSSELIELGERGVIK